MSKHECNQILYSDTLIVGIIKQLPKNKQFNKFELYIYKESNFNCEDKQYEDCKM